jgi:beta-xylosidase
MSPLVFPLMRRIAIHAMRAAMAMAAALGSVTLMEAANPVITDVFTADPAPLVVGDTVYLYCGQDEAKSERDGYRMFRWLCFSTTDMKTWKAEGSPLAPKDFAWASGDAWASQVIERNGKFYWYAAVQHDQSHSGKAIGVAVADKPTGPFVDARGSALVTNDMTKATKISWDDIDPSVFIDADGQAWLFWGNQKCYYAKLKPNMTELDGPIEVIPDEQVKGFTEAPWLHKRGDLYYLSYATGFPEKMAYSTATKITGPWTFRGLLTEGAFNSNTIHQGIINFKGVDYFVYHNGSMQHPNTGGSFRRSVCVDYLYYNPDGTIRRILQTTEGVDLPPVKPATE